MNHAWNFISKYQLQELIITLMVVEQIECFWCQFKAENQRISKIQLIVETIEMMQMYNQIEYMHYNDMWNLLHLLSSYYYFHYYNMSYDSCHKKERKNNRKRKIFSFFDPWVSLVLLVCAC